MRESFSFDMIPIVQDNMNDMPGVKNLTSVSSNGYYGYQPLVRHKEEEHPHPCYMEVQFERHARKRNWEYADDFREFKKRRRNEGSPFASQQPTQPYRDVNLRKPTHNIPDMPRCIMGHYI